MRISFCKPTSLFSLLPIAALIGCPLAYFAAKRFLQNYSYRTDLNWMVFVLTALIVIGASIAIVIYQVLKAAMTNPVDALRNE